MVNPVVVVGIGELGSTFAQGFLKTNHPVYPITRGQDLHRVASKIPPPGFVLIAVAEDDLHPVLDQLPPGWGDRLGLLQNELLPKDWQQYDIIDPTVISVWFEKKKGQTAKVLLPSPVFGPKSGLVAAALRSLDIPTKNVADKDALLYELVRKNVYILTTNIAGLEVQGNVQALWEKHRTLAEDVAKEVIAIQSQLCQTTLSEDALIKGMLEAFDADPEHKCMGRTAKKRLERALDFAQKLNVDTPVLSKINSTHS